MKIGKLIYNQVLYDHRQKKIAAKLLKSPLLIKNPVYNFFYNRLLTQKMKQFEKIPFRVMIENTNVCNANCIFCPHKIMKRKVGVMNMGLFKKIIEECKKVKIEYVTIYGFGEPLLDNQFFERVEYTKSVGIQRVTTNTNGMYLDEEKIEKVFNSGLDEIYVSFDAATSKTYKKIRPGLDFQIVKNNILNLVKEKERRQSKKPEIILSYVESRDNKHEIKKYIKQWKGMVDNISVSFIQNWTGDIESGEILMVGRRDPCRLLWTDMVISWNGDVPLCCNDYGNRMILGNINDQSIKEIWGGDKLRKIRELHKGGEFEKINICAQCEYNFHHKSPWWVSK
jgi:radical SAM protein with 4Fe4S-binding SPASM domain